MNLAAFIRLDDSRFTGTARRASRAVGGLRRRITGLVSPLAAMTAGFLGAAGTIGLFWKSIGEAAQAERAKTTLKVLTGSAETAKQVFDDLQEFSDVTPFEPGPVQEAGKQLIAYGFALEDLNGLLKDAGDLSATFNADISETARVFGRLASGDFGEAFERLRDFGISRDQLQAEGLEFDGGGSFVGSAEEAMTAVRSIIRREYGGMMQDVSQTWEGMVSTLKGKMDARFRDFGTPIMEEMKSAVQAGIEWFDGMGESVTGWGETVADGIAVVREAFSQGQLGELATSALEVAALSAVDIMLRGFALAGEYIKRGVESSLSGTTLGQSLGIGGPSGADRDVAKRSLMETGVVERRFGALQLTDRGESMADARGITGTPTDRVTAMIDEWSQMVFEQNRDRDLEEQTENAFDGRTAVTEMLAAAKDAFTDLADDFRADADSRPVDRSTLGPVQPQRGVAPTAAPAGPGPGIVAPPDLSSVVAQAVGQFNADRLQRIGMFVGGKGPAVDYQRQTVRNTAKIADVLTTKLTGLQKSIDNLKSGNGPATWG